MTTVEARIEALEARIAELEESAAEAEIVRYRGRLDDLGVQAALARMEARDDVRATLDRLDRPNLFLVALDHLRHESSAGSRGVTDSVREAIGGLRSSFDDATAALRRTIEGSD